MLQKLRFVSVSAGPFERPDTYAPVTSADMAQVDDIVFCEVQTSNRFYAHLVKNKYLQGGAWVFKISNMQGWVNGWCRIEHIYGKLIE